MPVSERDAVGSQVIDVLEAENEKRSTKNADGRVATRRERKNLSNEKTKEPT
jgi:hypothetical protein